MVLRLSGNEVAYAYGYLAGSYGLAATEPIGARLDPDQKVKLKDALDYVEAACQRDRLDLPVTLMHIPRVRATVEQAKTHGDVRDPVGELRSRMHDELKSKLFLFIPTIEATYYNRKEAFGATVAVRLSDASDDIESASDCIALGVYTASVFHLMRVMERAVQALGAKLGYTLAQDKQWQTILDQINKAVAALPDGTPDEKTTKARHAEVASNLYNVKLAWRNQVMHPKASYSPESALEIYGAVKTFVINAVELI